MKVLMTISKKYDTHSSEALKNDTRIQSRRPDFRVLHPRRTSRPFPKILQPLPPLRKQKLHQR